MSSEGSFLSFRQTTFPRSLRGLDLLWFFHLIHFPEGAAAATGLDIQSLTLLPLPVSIAAGSDHYISQESQQRHQPEAAGELLVLARQVKRETDHGGSCVVANEVRGESWRP